MSLRLNRTGRIPPSDGVSHWRLPVGDVIIRGKGFDDLVKNVFEYKLRSNLPIGDIESDLDDYYCSRYPRFCQGDASTPSSHSTPHYNAQPLLNRVSMWVSSTAARMPRGGYSLVAVAEAERRAAICVACPRNRAWRGGCAGCSSITLQLTQAVKNLKKTPRDGNLMACEIAGYELGAGIWLPTEALPMTDTQRAEMPGPCWRKAIP